MKFRKAVSGDIPAIVDLLKLSLGENLVPKSEAYWRWKHIDNPFGASPVLIAEENSKLVSVRAFMRWKWKNEVRIFNAVRAVDTATHPDYQGRGLFRKLTLQLVDTCEEEELDFIFNTPNKKSRQGYLKMGWVSVGRLPVRFVFLNPVLSRLVSMKVTQSGAIGKPFADWISTKDAQDILDQAENVRYGPSIQSAINKKYLEWRYGRVPNLIARYFVLSRTNETDFELIIYRIKETRFGREMRLTEVLTNNKSLSKAMIAALISCACDEGASYIAHAGTQHLFAKGLTLPIGPMVTMRYLKDEVLKIDKFEYWCPSLGDMELF